MAEANVAELKEEFPGIAEFGHDTSMYERNVDDDTNWSEEEDIQRLIQDGELSAKQLGILHQAEEELAQISNFSRLLPQKNSER